MSPPRPMIQKSTIGFPQRSRTNPSPYDDGSSDEDQDPFLDFDHVNPMPGPSNQTPLLTVNGRIPESERNRSNRQSATPITPPSAPPFGYYVPSDAPGMPMPPPGTAYGYPSAEVATTTQAARLVMPSSQTNLVHPISTHTQSSPDRNSNAAHNSGLNPYLGLRTRLSLTLLSLPLLSLLLSIASLLSASAATDHVVSSAKAEIKAKCAGANEAMRWLTDGGLAKVMAEKINEETVKAVKATLSGLRIILVDSLTIMESVIKFAIDMYRSLLMCTFEFVVRGTLSILIGAVQTISSAVTSSLNAIRTNIQDDISSANSVIASAVSGINKVTSLVNVNLDVPQFSIPALSSLENVTIPTTFEDDLIKLNSSIPSLDELRDAIDNLIDTPFEALKAKLNATMLNLTSTFNSSVLPVPEYPSRQYASLAASNSTSSDLCAGVDTGFLDDVANNLARLVKISIGLVVLAAFLAWLAFMTWEWWVWKKMGEQAEQVATTVAREGRVNGWQVVHIVEHPVLERYMASVLPRLSRRRQIQDNWRWLFSTITHGPALVLLLYGSFSFLAIQAQIGAVDGLRGRSTQQASTAAEASSQRLAQNLNEAMLGQSREYARDVNAVIAGWQDTIDEDLFGPWLSTTTVVLNGTLVKFCDEIEHLLNETLGSTVLASPANTFIYCILGSKIDKMEQALTWINQNAHVTLPTINETVLMMSDGTLANITAPIAQALAGSDDDGSGGVVGRIFDSYLSSLKKQRIAAALLLGLYALAVVIAFGIMAWHSWLRDAFKRRRLVQINRSTLPPPEPDSPWQYTQHASRSVPASKTASFSEAPQAKPRWSKRFGDMLTVPKTYFGGLSRANTQRSGQSWLVQSYNSPNESPNEKRAAAPWNGHDRGRPITEPFLNEKTA